VEVSKIIAEIDSQISKLQQARALLAGTETALVVKKGRGRPKGSKNSVPAVPKQAKTVAKKAAKRQLTPEGRKAIADAMKRRWEERRKAIAK
jgi:hypothetical protein